MKSKTKPIFVVFPGLGKTYLALHRKGIADCDYGYYRSSWPKSDLGKYPKNADLNYFTQHVIKIYVKEGFMTLTNEPALLPWLKQLGYPLRVVLPREDVDMAERVLQREKEHPVNLNWAHEYAKSWREWLEGWKRAADIYKIPVIYVTYLNEDFKLLK